MSGGCAAAPSSNRQSALATACRGKLPDRRLWMAQLSEELGGLYTLPQITIDDIFMVANGMRDVTKIGGGIISR